MMLIPWLDGQHWSLPNGTSDDVIAAGRDSCLQRDRKLVRSFATRPFNRIHLEIAAVRSKQRAVLMAGDSLVLTTAENRVVNP